MNQFLVQVKRNGAWHDMPGMIDLTRQSASDECASLAGIVGRANVRVHAVRESDPLADLARAIRRPVAPLRPYDELIAVAITDTAAMLRVRIREVNETSRELRLGRYGTRVTVWSLVVDGPAVHQGTMTVWDDEATDATIHLLRGKSLTPSQAFAQREWERDCFRPGNDRSPLDNYARVLEGMTAPKMEGYW